MKTTTYTWTKNLAALLLSTCLSVALLAPTDALAFSRVPTDSPARTSSQAASSSAATGFTRFAAWPSDRTGGSAASSASGLPRYRSWSPLAWWLAWLGFR